jgi:uncharacterized protein GlcG (DUF336 family)
MAEMAGAPFFQGLNTMMQGRFLAAQGAVPVMEGSEVVGAVGVSGGTAQQDEDCANAGLAAL